VNRILCRLRIDKNQVIQTGTKVVDKAGNVEIGEITSCAVDHFAWEAVALAMLKAKDARPDTPVAVRPADGELVAGTVFE
jgi:glycine cleavage system aminomethyltransferase T